MALQVPSQPRPARSSAVSRVDMLVRGRGDMTDILRAAPLYEVTRACGQCFASSKSVSAKDFALSAPVDQISVFISHSWSASRVGKYLALALHFDSPVALAGALAAALCSFALTAAGALPQRSLWCSASAMLAFVIVLLATPSARRLAAALRLAHGPFASVSVFLDKLCLCQTDDAAKRRGIESIGGFITASRVMLILWCPEYFERLWCRFELAAFQSSMMEDMMAAPARANSDAASPHGGSRTPGPRASQQHPHSPMLQRACLAASLSSQLGAQPRSLGDDASSLDEGEDSSDSGSGFSPAASLASSKALPAALPAPQPQPQPSSAHPTSRDTPAAPYPTPSSAHREWLLLPLSFAEAVWAISLCAPTLHALRLALLLPRADRARGPLVLGLALLGSAAAGVAVWAARKYARERLIFAQQLATRSVHDAKCTERADRALIFALITLWYGQPASSSASSPTLSPARCSPTLSPARSPTSGGRSNGLHGPNSVGGIGGIGGGLAPELKPAPPRIRRRSSAAFGEHEAVARLDALLRCSATAAATKQLGASAAAIPFHHCAMASMLVLCTQLDSLAPLLLRLLPDSSGGASRLGLSLRLCAALLESLALAFALTPCCCRLLFEAAGRLPAPAVSSARDLAASAGAGVLVVLALLASTELPAAWRGSSPGLCALSDAAAGATAQQQQLSAAAQIEAGAESNAMLCARIAACLALSAIALCACFHAELPALAQCLRRFLPEESQRWRVFAFARELSRPLRHRVASTGRASERCTDDGGSEPRRGLAGGADATPPMGARARLRHQPPALVTRGEAEAGSDVSASSSPLMDVVQLALPSPAPVPVLAERCSDFKPELRVLVPPQGCSSSEASSPLCPTSPAGSPLSRSSVVCKAQSLTELIAHSDSPARSDHWLESQRPNSSGRCDQWDAARGLIPLTAPSLPPSPPPPAIVVESRPAPMMRSRSSSSRELTTPPSYRLPRSIL